MRLVERATRFVVEPRERAVLALVFGNKHLGAVVVIEHVVGQWLDPRPDLVHEPTRANRSRPIASREGVRLGEDRKDGLFQRVALRTHLAGALLLAGLPVPL